MIPSRQSREAGNAIWFVLVAVALLAALTMAMTRSSDTIEQTGNVERLSLQASDLMRYMKGMQTTIEQMQLRGISESDLCFHDSGWGHGDYNGASCANPANQVFGLQGGGITWRTFDFVTSWDIFGSHLVQNLETANPELIIQAQISGALCRRVNTMLGIANPSDEAPVDDIMNIARFTGSFAAAAPDNIIGDDAAGLVEQATGCRKDGANYYYYQVLIRR
ncbi:MAG: hypothetical protein HYS17_04625 [Micavibrio aeruginosavorus]|uniref:Type 4 secretion system PilS N-terminal domain-containing protein n=1 Tax=Micavibrio aeruginosavorus TaxID=349221 RepID=A0A7T5UH93_9BACT|nr:MAG: hypothetical protein HYS17_04625 [Micavibrio aeruginosavorus]